MTETRRSRIFQLALSARARILGWVTLLAVMGLLSAGTAVFVVEATRIENRADRNIAQEFDELEQLQRGRNPRTGDAFASAEELLKVALEQNSPEEHEVLIGVVDDDARFVSADPDFDLARDEVFMSAATSLPDGGFSSLETPAGEVRFGVKPIVQGDVDGLYVVAYFTDPLRGEFVGVLRSYALVALITLLLIVATGWLVAGRLLRPIHELDLTARQITETDLAGRLVATGNDDVSGLANTFNAMLDRIQSAFVTQRQFLDDAGHELATPITIMLGHLELLDVDDRREVDTTRDLLVDELDRMARLVRDLIVLAKAERPDFLRLEVCDVGLFIDAAFQNASALGDRDWRIDSRAEGQAVVDAQRLTQALMQLASNAVRYGQPGGEVAVGSAFEGDTLLLWVRDTGPGIDPDEADLVFERFRRGSQAAKAEGSGIGLSIVRAIAEAHGGVVRLRSSPGQGATFTIRVPRRPVRTEESTPSSLAEAVPGHKPADLGSFTPGG